VSGHFRLIRGERSVLSRDSKVVYDRLIVGFGIMDLDARAGAPYVRRSCRPRTVLHCVCRGSFLLAGCGTRSWTGRLLCLGILRVNSMR